MNSTFTDPVNWSLNRPPLATDELVFDGDISSTSTTILRTAYTGLRLIDGYSGTVTLSSFLTVEDFEMRSGALGQPMSNSPLTVTNSFVWTGGTLNNTTNTSTVKIVGVDNAEMGAGGKYFGVRKKPYRRHLGTTLPIPVSHTVKL